MNNINRDAEGVVTADTGFTIKVPKDQTMLSALGHPGCACHMDFARDPDWIYVDGKPVQKQLSRISIDDLPARWIWGASLRDLAALEARYRRVSDISRAHFEQKWQASVKAIEAAGGKAHARVMFEYEGEHAPWWLYRVSDQAIGFNWVEEPAEPINLELGTAYYKANERSQHWATRKWKFETALRYALRLRLDAETGSNYGYLKDTKWEGKQIALDVNGRVYWYATQHVGHGLVWKALTWPESEPRILKITTPTPKQQ